MNSILFDISQLSALLIKLAIRAKRKGFGLERGVARGRETSKGLEEESEEARGRGVITEPGFGEVEGEVGMGGECLGPA